MPSTIHTLERKDCIKYLGMMLDETVSFKYHIAYVCSRTSRNLGIISKLRYYLTLCQLKQIYYSLACVASVSVRFGSKELQGRAINGAIKRGGGGEGRYCLQTNPWILKTAHTHTDAKLS